MKVLENYNWIYLLISLFMHLEFSMSGIGGEKKHD